MTDHSEHRTRIRRLRRALPAAARRRAQASALRRLCRLREFRYAHTIAGYFGNQGELDPMPALEQAARGGKRCYLPILHPFLHGRLLFAQWQPGDRLAKNRFGIPEPILRGARLLPARRLDLVITPLLAFDAQCHRIGMGGGYYDRSFGFLHRRSHWCRPRLIGLAYAFQQVPPITPSPWDVRLDKVVTDTGVITAQTCVDHSARIR